MLFFEGIIILIIDFREDRVLLCVVAVLRTFGKFWLVCCHNIRSFDMQQTRLVVFCACLLVGTLGQFTTIAIVATNDIHGTAFPAQMQRSDNKQNYTYGGLVYMGSLIEVIKSEYPGHTLFFDAGDQFQGGIQSSPLISEGKIMNDFYDALDLTASAIGNHEFDFGPSFLLPYMSGKEGTNLAANIRSQKGESEFLPKQKLSQMYEFASGIRIGMIGLSTINTPTTTNGFKDGKFPPYKFLEYKDIVIEEGKKLRKSGAHAVLIVGHLGNDCNASNVYGKWTVDSKQEDCGAGEAGDLIDALPSGTIDGILQGHVHKFAHHFHKGIPFVGTINGGYYLNVLYLRFHKTTLIEKTIEGPIPVCEKVFANFGTCEYLSAQKLAIAGELVPFKFHNQLIVPHPKVNAIYQQEWLPKMLPFFEYVAETQIYLTTQSDQQCELANLVSNLIHAAVPDADFSINNLGGLRTVWLPGIIQYQHYYNMFPFINYLVSFDMTGDELLRTLAVIQGGTSGFYPSYGIRQTVKIDKNGKKHFVNATWMNGEEIVASKMYRGVAIDFLLNGGDDFSAVMDKIYTIRNSKTQGQMKGLLKQPLKDLRYIKKGSLIDPQNPRLIVLKQ